MRLIFFTLMFANLAVAVWGLLFLSPSSGASPSLASQPSVVAKTPNELIALDGGAGSDKNAKKLCELVGPFNADVDAKNFVERLSAIGVGAEMKSLELPGGLNYWIHLPPESSREAAFRKLADLQAQNIESYVIGRGRLRNAVSLGIFSQEPIAAEHLAKMRAAGLDAQRTVFERKELELWVEIPPTEADKMSSITWSRMLEGYSAQERRQNFCLPVAS